MFFRTEMCLIKKFLQAVRWAAIYHLECSKGSKNKKSGEKTSRCISLGKRGSLTVEAALTGSFLLLGVTALLYLFILQELKTDVDRALTNVGKELSQNVYFMDSDSQSFWTDAAVAAYGNAYVKDYLRERKTVGILKHGMQSMSFLGSNWDATSSELTFRVTYQVQVPLAKGWFHPITVVQTKKVRGWNGFRVRELLGTDLNDEMVYVTEYGEVYHRELDCRHLKLSIRQVAYGEVAELRNSGGARYYSCESCWKMPQNWVYITEDGNRYHATLHCRGLSRGIRTMRLSLASGLSPCSVCGE